MNTYARPDIAKGIFYEYLRLDDPISPEFRDNVVLGFPFLLAPLAQVKGVHMPHSSPLLTPNSLPPHKALWQMFENAHAGFAEWAEGAPRAALEAASQQAATVGKFVEQGAQNLLQEANRRRVAVVHQAQGLPAFVRSVIRTGPVPTVVVNDTLLLEPLEDDPNAGRLTRLLLDQIYPDEIGPPVRQRHAPSHLFLLLVHLYLLLLLIVSFPGSYTTKLIRRKKSRVDKSRLPLKASKTLSYYL